MDTSSVPLKRCTKCGKEFPATVEYFTLREGKLRGNCRECDRERARRYFAAHTEKVLEKNRVYQASHPEQILVHKRRYHANHADKERKYKQRYRSEHKVENRTYEFNYRVDNPDKARAHRLINKAIRRGDIPKAKSLFCADCGDNAHDYHHEDYSKPLEVVPLCFNCHRKRHRKYA